MDLTWEEPFWGLSWVYVERGVDGVAQWVVFGR